MPGSYTLELEVFSLLNATTSDFEIWADGAQLGGGYSISSSGTSISVTVPYGGALPSSLQFRFDDSATGSTDRLEIRSIRINGRAVNEQDDLTTTVLNDGNTSNVTISEYTELLDDSDPIATTFTIGSTQTYTGAAETYNDYSETTDQVFDMLGGNDIAYLGAGDDTVSGGAGNDKLFGRDGEDLLFGDSGNDKLDGGAGNDSLYGGIGNDRLFGRDGDDFLSGGTGDDALNGNDGHDTIFGGDGDDRLNGSDGDDFLYGDDGEDRLVGGYGDDTIDGGADNDVVFGGAGADNIHGGTGDDTLIGNDGDDVIHGDDGNDTILGLNDNDSLYGGDGDDVIAGHDGNDILDGGAGNDSLIGGAGTDTLSGGTGNDILHGNGLTPQQIQIILNANANVVYNAETNSFYEFVTSGATWTASQTAAAATTLNGVNGHLATVSSFKELDFLDAQVNPTNNLSIGSYWTSGHDLAVTGEYRFTDGIETGVQFWDGQDAGSTTYGFEDMWVSGQPNSATQHYNYLLSYADGLADSNDAAFAHGDGYIVEWDAGLMNDDNAVDTLNGGAGNDQIYGYGGNDILNGGDGNDALYGGAGADQLFGGDGNDALLGGAGNDLLVGSLGDDYIDGGEGDDTIVGIEGFTIDINTLTSYGGGQDVGGTVTFEGNGVTLDGNLWKKFDFDYTVTANTVIEFDFRSTLAPEIAGIGFETNNAISSNLTFNIYGTQNWGRSNYKNYDGSGDWVHYKIPVGTFYTGNFVNLFLANDDDDNNPASGTDGNSSWANIIVYEDDNADTSADILNGGGGNDTINGNNGNNVIAGGDGFDTLYGYAGADTFLFENANAFNNVDSIQDFSTAENDALDLSNLLTGYAFGSDDITDFVQILTDGADSDVYVDVDGLGVFGAATQIATLFGVTGLTDEAALEASNHLITA